MKIRAFPAYFFIKMKCFTKYLFSSQRYIFGPWILNIHLLSFLLGYWGMYLVGVHLGYKILFSNHSSKKVGSIQSARARVWILAVLFW